MALVGSASFSHNSAINGSRGSSLPDSILSYNASVTGQDVKTSLATPFELHHEIEGIGKIGTLGRWDSLNLALKESWATWEEKPQVVGEDAEECEPKPPLLAPLPDIQQQDQPDQPDHPAGGPFKKWMKHLHRRAADKSSALKHHRPFWRQQGSSDGEDGSLRSHLRRQTSSTGSSFGFVAAVRSASISLASVSSVARSRRNTGRSRAYSKTDRSSRASLSMARMSEDSAIAEKALLRHNAAAMERAMQRRRILEEIIATEESYIRDLRFLVNVYITILASLPSQGVGLRSSINRNLTDIIELHDEILGELHRVVPNSEYSQSDSKTPLAPLIVSSSQSHVKVQSHRRWRSLDAVPEDGNTTTLAHETSGLLADPQVAADVARVFGKRMNRFFIYKEYGAKYDMMTTDMGSASSSIPDWDIYSKGLEALASTVGPAKTNKDALKRSLTLSDLLMKPIQRICRYPLLFSELLKYTTVLDSPNSHMEVESTLTRLREATAEINLAADDSQVRATLEKTWLLQDRLIFCQRELDAVTRTKIRSFGRIHLCGALHVCWHENSGIDGQYMIALLYQDVLCLASAGKVDPIYTIMACINLHGAKVEDVNNGRGIQCQTAPYSWKLTFECDCELYEFLLTACSPKEEEEWRTRLARTTKHEGDGTDSGIFSSTELQLKSLGTVFGKQGTAVRKLAINRATTVSPKVPTCPMILKNTSSIKEGASMSTNLTIHRSQSLLATNARLPVLAPARAERVRLECLLGDVWSREVLPFSGINLRPGSGHLVRASSMMRKLSMANLADSLNKRSVSISRRTLRLSEDGLSKPSERFDSISSEPDTAPKTSTEGDSSTATTSKLASTRGTLRSVTESELSGTGFSAPTSTLRKRRAGDDLERASLGDGCSVEPSFASVLRKSSGNSIRLTRSDETGKSEKTLQKENSHNVSDFKGLGRWTKVTQASKDVSKGHVLRSLFR